MQQNLIQHIGFLVPDLEDAIARWIAVTGYSFKGPVRFHAEHHVDSASPEPRLQVNRIALSIEGPPHIELVEVVPGSGSHGPSEVGPHHICFRGIADPEAHRRDLAERGVPTDAMVLDEDGNTLLFFTDKAALDGIRLEMVGTSPGRVFTDDGSREILRDPVTGIPDLSVLD